MSIKSQIFAQFRVDEYRYLASFLSGRDAVALSRVEQVSYKALSNAFFQLRFKREHPDLLKYNVFPTLQIFHPTNCWKIACCCFSKVFPEISNSDYVQAPVTFCFLINSERERLEIERREICGPGGERSNLTVRQAEDLFIKEKKELTKVQYLQKKLFEELKELDPTQNLQLIFLFVSIIEKHNSMCAEVAKLENAFKKIEALDDCEFRIKRINLMVDSLHRLEIQREIYMRKNTSFYDYVNNLINERSNAVKLEKAHTLRPILTECYDLIEGINKKEIESAAKNLDRIKELINSYAANGQGGMNIWSCLYFRCARNNREQDWAQNHFHEFLPELMQIVQDAVQPHISCIDKLKNLLIKQT